LSKGDHVSSFRKSFKKLADPPSQLTLIGSGAERPTPGRQGLPGERSQEQITTVYDNAVAVLGKEESV